MLHMWPKLYWEQPWTSPVCASWNVKCEFCRRWQSEVQAGFALPSFHQNGVPDAFYRPGFQV